MRRQHHAAVTPSRGGRQNDLLGLSEFCRRHVRDPPGFAARAAATTAAPLRRQRRRGRIPEKPSPRTTTLPLRSRQNASPFCDHLLALFARVECENACQGSRHAVHNRLVGGLSPPGPTTQPGRKTGFPEASRESASLLLVSGWMRRSAARSRQPWFLPLLTARQRYPSSLCARSCPGAGL